MATETTICIAGDTIKVITGSASGKQIKIKAAQSYPLAEGTLINGVATDEAALKSALQEIARKNRRARKARLVIDSSLILTKHFAVPAMGRRQLLRVARRELAEFEGGHEGLIYDYASIRPQDTGAAGAILCCAVERRMVDGLAGLFAAAGIKLLSADVALACAIKLVRFIPALREQTFILTVLDAGTVLSMLFVGGAYAFSSRSRLLAERGSDMVASELSGKISSMIQFNKAQKTGCEIAKAYFCGLREDETDSCRLITDMFGIDADILPGFDCVTTVRTRRHTAEDYTLSGYLFGTGGILRK